MRDCTEFVIMKIKFPKHLAEWLEKFSKEIAKTPDQVLIHILTYYFETWKVGYEAVRTNSTEMIYKLMNVLLNKYVNDYKGKAKNKYIIEKFISWVTKRSYNLSCEILRNAVDEFMNEYKEGRGLGKRSVSLYKFLLNDFINYICS